VTVSVWPTLLIVTVLKVQINCLTHIKQPHALCLICTTHRAHVLASNLAFLSKQTAAGHSSSQLLIQTMCNGESTRTSQGGAIAILHLSSTSEHEHEVPPQSRFYGELRFQNESCRNQRPRITFRRLSENDGEQLGSSSEWKILIQ